MTPFLNRQGLDDLKRGCPILFSRTVAEARKEVLDFIDVTSELKSPSPDTVIIKLKAYAVKYEEKHHKPLDLERKTTIEKLETDWDDEGDSGEEEVEKVEKVERKKPKPKPRIAKEDVDAIMDLMEERWAARYGPMLRVAPPPLQLDEEEDKVEKMLRVDDKEEKKAKKAKKLAKKEEEKKKLVKKEEEKKKLKKKEEEKEDDEDDTE
jgi:hypothetical protein